MTKRRIEQHDRIRMIKEGARTANDGRSYLLQGLWACRLALGLSQRQVAEMIGSNQKTVRELERQSRGAYPMTIRKLSQALKVDPEDLICGSAKREEARQ